jgi:hypothetical protein
MPCVCPLCAGVDGSLWCGQVHADGHPGHAQEHRHAGRQPIAGRSASQPCLHHVPAAN